MFSEVEQYIQNEFMILEDVNLLNTTAYYDNWEKEIEAIGAKYMVKIPKLEMCGPSGPTCKKGESTCCSSGTKCSGTSWFASLFN